MSAIELDENTMSYVLELRATREQIKALHEREEALKMGLEDALDGADEATYQGVPVLRITETWSERIDVKALKASTTYAYVADMFTIGKATRSVRLV